jgi:hypothetical protein
MVILRARLKDVLIKDSHDLLILGSGYETEEQATAAGDHYRGALTRTFARFFIGADFGDLSGTGGFTEMGLRWLEGGSGSRVLKDIHGLMTFESEPPPRFAESKASFLVTTPGQSLTKVLSAAMAPGPNLLDHERRAFNFYSGSSFMPPAIADAARLMLLTMAVEALLEPAKRSANVIAHVDELVRATKQSSSIPENEKESLVGSLEWLHYESIGQAGRRLAGGLAGRNYGNMDPEAFFTYCYGIRSKLVHGHATQPEPSEIRAANGELARFVADLLSGPLLSLEL